MQDLCGHPVIYWVLKRTSMAKSLDGVVLATTTKERDDPLIDVAAELGLEAFRYEVEDDVLGRFARAARHFGAKTISRVCADSPLVDPDVIDHAVDSFIASNADYAFNHVPRLDNKYPDGLGTELVSAKVMNVLDHEAKSAWNREACFSYIWENSDRFKIQSVECPEAWQDHGEGIRLDVDWPEDLIGLRALCDGLTVNSTAVDILHRWRQLGGIIRHVENTDKA